MKKTYTKILSAALTVALLASLILGIVPVAAMTQPTVTLSATGTNVAYQISSANTYTITYTSAIYCTGNISIVFPTGTVLPATVTGSMLSTAGVNDSLGAVAGIPSTPITFFKDPANSLKITFALPAGGIGINSIVRVVVDNVTNPPTAGNYTLSVTAANLTVGGTSETATSAAYAIKAVSIGAVPGIVTAYNSANQIVYQFNSADSISEACNVGGAVKIVVGPGTYAITQNIVPLEGQTIVSSDGKATTFISLTDIANIQLTNPGVIFDGFTVANTTTFIGATNIFVNAAHSAISNPKTTTIQNCTLTTLTNGVPAINVDDVNDQPLVLQNSNVITSGAATNAFSNGIAIDYANGSSSDSDTVSIRSVNFTVDAGDIGVLVNRSSGMGGLSISGCSFSGVANTGTGISDSATSGFAAGSLTVSSCTFNLLLNGIAITNAASNVTIGSGNTFAACGTATDPPAGAVSITGAGATVKINNNTFSGNTGYSVYVADAGSTGSMSALGNSFTNNARGMLVAAGSTTTKMKAIMNWWGAATGPNTTGADKVSSSSYVTTSPYLTAATSSSSSLTTAATPVATVNVLDASISVGVKVSFIDDVNASNSVIASKYATNPTSVAPPGTAVLGYYDVFTSAIVPHTITLQFYPTGISPATNVYFYSALQAKWVLCDTITVSGNGAYVIVIINSVADSAGNPFLYPETTPNTGDLSGTIFAVVTGVAPAPPSFNVVSPAIGSNTGLTNIPFAWASVSGATSYTFKLSKNADLSSPIATQNTTGTAYTYTGTLTAGPYYWQVTASTGAVSVTGTFIAVTPPATTATVTTTLPAVTTTIAPTTTVQSTIVITTVSTNVTNTTITQPITVTTQPPATIVFTTVTQPPVSITFTNPPATTLTTQVVEFTEITPAWIYVIIGIGAVLIIVVVVLVVRTRRTV